MEAEEELAVLGENLAEVEDLVVMEDEGTHPLQCILSNQFHHMSCRCTMQSIF